MDDDGWIFLKDQTPPIGAWVRVRGWHEITARYQPNNLECEWLQDEFSHQDGRARQWRLTKQGELSEQAKKIPLSKR